MRNTDDRKRRDEALLRRIRASSPAGDARREDAPGADARDADLRDEDASDATAELLSHYRGSIYQWCYRYLRDHDRALDLAQEVILETCRALPRFDGRASFSSWLFAITRNRCVSALRRSARAETADYDLDLIPDSGDRPDRALERKERRERILGAMREVLAPREQEALCLRVFDGMPVDAITEVLGLGTASGARSVLQNARRKLRAALATLDPALGEDRDD